MPEHLSIEKMNALRSKIASLRAELDRAQKSPTTNKREEGK